MFLLSGFALATLLFLLDYCFIPGHAPNEPPVVRSSIPYVGHIVGLLRHGSRYYQILSHKCKLPIYTLPMLHVKMYVVTSVDLVNAVNRNAKVLAFNPFIAQLGKRITGHDEATSLIVQHNLNAEDGPGYVTDIHDGTVTSLAPGASLENMTHAMLMEASTYLRRIKSGDIIDLFAWTRHMVTMCSTRAIYGLNNPFNRDEKKFVKAFWHFDHDLNNLILDFMPRLLAPKGHKARSELGLAFQQYYEQYNAKQSRSAALIEARYSTNSRYGLTAWNAGRLEVGVLLGILANTIPTIFYMLVHILSDPALLRDARKEIETTSLRQSTSDKKRCLLILSMREKCTLLHSTFQEVLRLHAHGSSVRYVREDITLNNRYLLKKGMILQMPMAVMHSSSSVWGSDAHEFKANRFLKLPKTTTVTTTTSNNTNKEFKNTTPSYRPFGGGASLCPGRHFVTLEAMALTAWFVLRFDAVPVNGKWQIPRQKQESMATNVFPPEEDIKIEIRERAGFEGTEWDFEMA